MTSFTSEFFSVESNSKKIGGYEITVIKTGNKNKMWNDLLMLYDLLYVNNVVTIFLLKYEMETLDVDLEKVKRYYRNKNNEFVREIKKLPMNNSMNVDIIIVYLTDFLENHIMDICLKAKRNDLRLDLSHYVSMKKQDKAEESKFIKDLNLLI